MTDLSLTTKERLSAAMIESLSHGGYVIREGHKNPGDWRAELAAFSSLEEALNWLRVNMAT